MARNLVVLDPNSLLGRELVPLLAASFPNLQRRYMHTRGVDDYLLLELEGNATVVPPLGDLEELADAAAVFITEPPASALKMPLAEFFAAHPQLPCFDLSSDDILPADLGMAPTATRPQLRLPDPVLLLPTMLLRALGSLLPKRAFFSCLVPVSIHGEAALEELAAQAAARLSGDRPKTRLFPAVLAFDAVPYQQGQKGHLEEQLQKLFPQTQVQLHPIAAGIFHAHAVFASVEVDKPATLQKLRQLFSSHGFVFSRGKAPLAASLGAGKPQAKVVKLASHHLALWAVGDHLLMQAQAACDALATLLARVRE
ncbi:MAG: Asd/ArgC dimerization domain-containing protein [Thermoanaerobaculaceae bacterium]